jgi:redox-sensitive bicupin YhaK (pirin superfamily)
MGFADHGWLKSFHHFSFADYYNPRNINFGVLRVLNDDIVEPDKGFDTHPHQNMEILSYVVEGELTHADSMGNERVLTRGQVQYMSAGTGVFHSEYNKSARLLRFLQIWIFPNKENCKPAYGDYRFEMNDRLEKWMPIASSAENKTSAAPIHIHQDINAYAALISKGKTLEFEAATGRQAYYVQIEGGAAIAWSSGKTELCSRDAAEIIEEKISVTALEDSHSLVIEMKKQ